MTVDGIVGNQTWSAIREEPPRPPGTAGREPGTYEEVGPEARWATDDDAVPPEPITERPDAFTAIAHDGGSVDLPPGGFQAPAIVTSEATGPTTERLLEGSPTT